MDLRALELFRAVARSGGFAAAADDADLSASAVSRRIATLEAELGARLLHRTTRAVSLTEAGARFLARAEAILEEADAARDEARGVGAEPAGVLKLTASTAYGERVIVPLMAAFREAYPQVTLDLLFTDAVVDLAAERVDLAVRLGPRPEGEGISTRLAATRYRVYASPAYLEREGAPATPEHLADRPAVVMDVPGYRTQWRFRGPAGDEARVPIASAVSVSSALSARTLTLDGVGPSLLADWLCGEDAAAGRLVDLFPDHEIAAREFETAAWLLYPSRAYLPRKVRAMIDFLKSLIGR